MATTTPDYDKLWKELQAKQDTATRGYYQTQRDMITANADEQRRQAEINYQKSLKDLPSQMARLGLKGTGAAESSLISSNNAYQELLNSIRDQQYTSEREMYANAWEKALSSKADNETSKKAKGYSTSFLTPNLLYTDADGKTKETKEQTEQSRLSYLLYNDPNTLYANNIYDMYKAGKITAAQAKARLAGIGYEFDA